MTGEDAGNTGIPAVDILNGVMGCGNPSQPDNLRNCCNHQMLLGVVTSNSSLNNILLADDDLAAHMPTALEQKIFKGDYVKLALLLKGYNKQGGSCR